MKLQISAVSLFNSIRVHLEVTPGILEIYVKVNQETTEDGILG
jgi:hypothetical protein